MKIGVCYYPEHWPTSQWQAQAEHMRGLGITMVRIGEFAWSRLEPKANEYQFDWLAKSIDILGSAGLEVVLGTPTATPPAWLVRKHPDMLAVDVNGRLRQFGSRRHYCFSSMAYREECERIVQKLAQEFGRNDSVVAWQTDNEYGCHSTTISYSKNALAAFRKWCANEYSTIDNLNQAWGNVFWSMEYSSFDEIELPSGTVTESSPAHRLAFWRFSSHQIKTFNQLQVNLIRPLSPGRDIVHNFMGNFIEFDHFDVSQDLDVATWDSYPLGMLTRDSTNHEDQKTFCRTGEPDSSAFHHDLYRACGKGRMWVMEQQPGPVNWAPFNPAPLPGMVRLWGWEAFAHGAEVVSYFRYRQAPFAQEQMHAGLCLPDGREDDAAIEVKVLAKEIEQTSLVPQELQAAPVAIVFDYAGDQAARIQQPYGQNYDPLVFIQSVYSVVRQLGVQVDFVSGQEPLDNYRLIILANSTISDEALAGKLSQSGAHIIMFPRTGSKTAEYSIPEALPPGAFQSLINIKVTRVESLPANVEVKTDKKSTLISWRERVEANFPALEHCDDGWGFHYSEGNVHYFNACSDRLTLIRLLKTRLDACGLEPIDLGRGLRITKRGELTLAFNYGPTAAELNETILSRFGYEGSSGFLIGQSPLGAGDVAAWKSV